VRFKPTAFGHGTIGTGSSGFRAPEVISNSGCFHACVELCSHACGLALHDGFIGDNRKG